MKPITPILLAYLCLVWLNSYAQFPGENRNDYSPYGLNYTMLDVNMRLLANHGDATQITYFDLNFVDQRMQNFMGAYMHMEVAHFPTIIKQGIYNILTIRYLQQATMGTTHIPSLYFKYTYFVNKDNHPIIKSLYLYGDANYVIDFYVRYWPTTINFDETRNKIAYNYLLQDKATIRFNGTWSITIENTTIHSMDEYYNQLNKASNVNISLESEYSKKEKRRKDSINAITIRDSLYRDSLLNLADKYNIPYGNKDRFNPTTQWLEMVIGNKEAELNGGKNYNKSDAGSIINLIIQKVKPEPNYQTGVLVFRINSDGIITKVTTTGMCNIQTSVLDDINKIADNQPLYPFEFNGKKYPSYKVYSIQYIPTTMKSYSISEVVISN